MLRLSRKPQTKFGSALAIAEVVYHSVVRGVRSQHGNAFVALGLNILQSLMLVAIFYLMFSLLGLRRAALRGDFLMYIMTGIFLFLTHNRTVSSIAGAEGPTSAMMQHAPMTTFVSILSQAFSALYTQLLSLTIILFIYHVAFNKLEIVDPSSALGMFLLAWFSGCGVGIVLLAIKPWAPRLCRIIMMAYLRLNMIASGKMFVANALPPSMIALFSWSPLFHSIDQVRGFVFINYYPRNSSWDYTLYVGVILIVIGMMAEFYTRKAASASWSARQ